jgi:CheY-like chemotaxis protein
MHILVVDDKQEARYFLEYLLKENNYNISCAANGKEALGILHEKKVDVIISDILMPVMDGFQLCREVKKR